MSTLSNRILCFLFLFFICHFSFSQGNYWGEPNTVIDRINDYDIDTIVRQNKIFAASNLIKEIYAYTINSPLDSTIKFIEQYDTAGRIQFRKEKSNTCTIGYEYDKKLRLSSFTKTYSYSDIPEITKIYYNEENRISHLQRVFTEHGNTKYWTDSMFYYPNGKLKKVNHYFYFYNEYWNLTSVVLMKDNKKNDTVTKVLYDKNNCRIYYIEKGVYADSIVNNADCQHTEVFYKSIYGQSINGISFCEFDERICYIYDDKKLVNTTYNVYTKKSRHKKPELKISRSSSCKYYDNGLLKAQGKIRYYYTFYNK